MYTWKKITLAVIVVGAFILYSLLYHSSNTLTALPITDTSSSSKSLSRSTPIGTVPPGTAVPGSLYKDGAYTGSVADAHWGNIQVKVTIQSGKITDVEFLQYPNERSRSVRINNDADPQLASEAIQVQNANVDIITGATDTSEAFIQSLSDALTQAKAG